MIINFASGSSLAVGTTYTIYANNLIASTGIQTSSVTTTYTAVAPVIASITPNVINFSGYPESVSVSLNLGTGSTRVIPGAHLIVEASKGITDIGPDTLSGSILSTNLALNMGVQAGLRTLTMDFGDGTFSTRADILNINTGGSTTSTSSSGMVSVTSVTPNTSSNYVNISFSTPIRLSGMDGVTGTSDDASISILSPNLSPTSLSGTLMNSGSTLRVNMSSISKGSPYEIHLSNIVSATYGTGGDMRILPSAFDQASGMPLGFIVPLYWGTSNIPGSGFTYITRSNPPNGAGLMPVNLTTIQVFFSRAMNGATLTGSNISLLQNNAPMSLSGMTLSGGVINTGEYELDVGIPSGALSYGTSYALDLSSNIEDANGLSINGPNGYGNDQLINFVTAPNIQNTSSNGNGVNTSAAALGVMATTPFNGQINAPRNGLIQVAFSEPIDPSGNNLSNVLLRAYSSPTDTIGSVIPLTSSVLDPSGHILTLTPSNVLDGT